MSTGAQSSGAVRAAHNAAEALRAVNHTTIPGESALRWPSDACDELGALTVLAVRLPQALRQLAAFFDRELQAGHIRVVAGEFADDPLAAVAAAGHYLEQAAALATQLAEALTHAQTATSGMAADHEDGEPS